MGRELARQLVAEGCSVAMCDVSAAAMAETKRLCEVERLPQGLRITTHIADVSNEDDVKRFADEVAEQHDTDKIHLLFNNAGIGGGGSMIVHERAEWERTFNICWFGVYYCTRAFLPMMLKADRGHIVNTSSVNGFWASIGPAVPHTAYSAAKFAVKGFSEALQTDLRMNAPHIKCSVVMPGHIGTSIVTNSRKIQAGHDSPDFTPKELAQMRARVASMGHRRLQAHRRRHRQARPRARAALPRGCADHRRRGRQDHPRRGEGRALAHPGRQGRRKDRPHGARRTGAGLRRRLLPDAGQGSRLEARRQLTEPAMLRVAARFPVSGKERRHDRAFPIDAACWAWEWPAALFLPHPSPPSLRARPRSRAPTRPRQPPEQLMRGHAILARVLLIYENGLRRAGQGEDIDPAVFTRAAEITKRFIHDHQEKIEEELVFARFKKAGRMVELVGVLTSQHAAGAKVTDKILAAAPQARNKEPREAMARDVQALSPCTGRTWRARRPTSSRPCAIW